MNPEQQQKAVQLLTKIVKAARKAQRTGKNVALNKLMEQANKISEKIDEEGIFLAAPPQTNSIQFTPDDDSNVVFKQIQGEIIYEIVDEFEDSLRIN